MENNANVCVIKETVYLANYYWSPSTVTDVTGE